MKVLVGVSRIFVGFLFIISGLIKLNDPVGFSFKLGDYFAPEVLNLPFLELRGQAHPEVSQAHPSRWCYQPAWRLACTLERLHPRVRRAWHRRRR